MLELTLEATTSFGALIIAIFLSARASVFLIARRNWIVAVTIPVAYPTVGAGNRDSAGGPLCYLAGASDRLALGVVRGTSAVGARLHHRPPAVARDNVVVFLVRHVNLIWLSVRAAKAHLAQLSYPAACAAASEVYCRSCPARMISSTWHLSLHMSPLPRS